MGPLGFSKAILHFARRPVEEKRENRVLTDVVGDILLGVVGAHLLLVNVFLEDKAKDSRIDFFVRAQRALIEVPLPIVKVIEDRLKGFIRNLDGLAVAFGFFQFVYVKQAAVKIRNTAEQFIKPGFCAPYRQDLRERGEARSSGRKNRTCPCPCSCLSSIRAGYGGSRDRRREIPCAG